MTAETNIKKAGARALCDMQFCGFVPLGGSPRKTSEELMKQVTCLLKALSASEQTSADYPDNDGYGTLTPPIKAGALEGIASLASVAIFLMREG